jgi:hypothetical protein
VSRRFLSAQSQRKNGEGKKRDGETTCYAKILGERASLHEYPLDSLESLNRNIFVALK